MSGKNTAKSAPNAPNIRSRQPKRSHAQKVFSFHRKRVQDLRQIATSGSLSAALATHVLGTMGVLSTETPDVSL